MPPAYRGPTSRGSGQDAIALEPHDRQRFKRLTDRLLCLVTTGDLDGQVPVGDGVEPWERDDVQHEQDAPSDTRTAARCLWSMQEVAGGGRGHSS